MNIVPFRPTPEQLEIIHSIYTHGFKKIIILKARQLGMSTVIDIMLVDQALWREGFQGAIVDATQQDASKKLANKVRLAFENLPPAIKNVFEIGYNSDSRFSVRPRASQSHAWSEIQAGMNARGDTFAFLHISELGAIQLEDHHRATEIITGAIPAAKNGITIIESTWKGGKAGPFWELVSKAIDAKLSPENLTSHDFRLFFFPWFTDDQYRIEGNYDQISDETNAYLDQIEKEENVNITPPQRLWYYKVAMALGFYRFREYPSNLEECFRASIEGAVYQSRMLRARVENRVSEFSPAEDVLTFTLWDLGSPLNTTTWFVQQVGREFHFIDLLGEEDISLAERISIIRSKPYHYSFHLLPHDAAQKERSGFSFHASIHKLGLRNARIMPRPTDIWPGINHAHQMFSRFHFRLPQTDRGVDALSSYHTKKDKTNNYITETPVHDWTSHYADPIRLLAEADMNGFFSDSSNSFANSPQRRRKPTLARRR